MFILGISAQCFYNLSNGLKKREILKFDIKGVIVYDLLGTEAPKIAFCQFKPHLLMDRTDFWHGGSFSVGLPIKVTIFPFRPLHLPPTPPK